MSIKKKVLIVFLIGVVVRAWYFLYPLGRVSFVTVDEAVYGVQSLQILRGARPVFYPAQVYTGSFSAYLSATLYAIFGFNPIFLKVVPFIFSILFIFLNYKLARKTFKEENYAFLVLLLSSLATPFWNNWSSRAGTGYVEASVMGNLMMLVSIDLIYKRLSPRVESLLFFLLGFLGGLGFWLQPTIVYYMVPVFIYLLLGYKNLLKKKTFYLSILGFIVGCLPVINYNLYHNSGTTQALFKMPWGIKSGLFKLVSQGLPVILGTRTSNSTRDFFTPFTLVIGATFTIAVLYLVRETQRIIRQNLRQVGLRLEPTALILLTFFSTVVIFLISTPFNQFSVEPRYVFSLYSTIPLILSFFLVRLWGRARIIFVFVCSVFLANWALGAWLAGPLTFNDNYRVEALADYLEERGDKIIISDPALGHRLMFYSSLSILTAVRGGGITEWRFPEINQRVITERDTDNSSVSFVAMKNSSFDHAFTVEANGFLKDRVRKLTVDGIFTVLEPVK